ncbi:MAG: RNA-binding transcriptional accessory protein [Chloroflexi bacterium]|nr:RNA-binding transcriptional accessory protein [Chloroflexota bacterium]
MTTRYDQKIAALLKLRPAQVGATIELLDTGNTLPFIARYRKEITGGLDEDQIRRILESATRLRAVDERRDTIIASIEEQGLLTPELQGQIAAADTLTELEDLYQPFKPKRRTRASIARDRGLQPLADLIVAQARVNQTAEQLAVPFVSEAVPTVEDALAGARDIVAETISEHADVRGQTRLKAMRFGLLRAHKTKDAKDDKGVYQLYYEFEYRVDRIKPYQVMAINRGEAEKVLRVSLDVAERDWRQAIETVFRPDRRSPLVEQLELAIEDAAKRLLLPAIERDVRAALTEQAEDHAIAVFATNLRNLLNQPPLTGHTVLGIDPGFRTGCKVAVIDPTGRVLATETIYPHEPQRRWNDTLRTLAALVERFGVTLIAIGNGTASRETEQLAAELTRNREGLHYLMVSEAGASVYSASPLARAELPDLDVTLRGAVSIARRVMDPLAELVKIEPKAIGVGMYQHDVNQKRLSEALDSVVETVVNRVGVDVNTASPALLTHVAGIGPKLAERIVSYRNENGAFRSRKALQQVPGLGPKAYEQAAGFLRIREGDELLDASAIHPESYHVARALLQRAGLTRTASLAEREAALDDLQSRVPLDVLAAELGTGIPTLTDILEQLIRPGRDPRADLPAPILRSDVLSMDDLLPGMRLYGTVRNVVDFGAFVDIGVKQDGLLHRSQLPPGYVLNLGDVIQVEILNVEKERGRISLGWPMV